MWVMVVWICIKAQCTMADTGAFFSTREACTASLEEFVQSGYDIPKRGGSCIKSDNMFGE